MHRGGLSKWCRRRGSEDVMAPGEELVEQLRAAALDTMAIALVEHQLLGFVRLGIEHTRADIGQHGIMGAVDQQEGSWREEAHSSRPRGLAGDGCHTSNRLT